MAISKTFRNFSFSGASPNAADLVTSVTSAAFDSTGEKAVVVWAKHEGAPTTITLSDNKGNTYTPLTKVDHSNNDLSSRIAYVLSPGSVGTGHTVTVTLGAARPYIRLAVWTITAGAAPTLDTSVQTSGASATPNAGNLVTSAASVSFLGVGEYAAVTFTPDAGWTEDVDNASHVCSRADASSGTFAASSTASASMSWVANAASFVESAVAVALDAGEWQPQEPQTNPLTVSFWG